MKPDYGLYLSNQGYRKDKVHFFYSVPIDHISIINNALFATMVNRVVDGVEYAVSFDFEMGLIGNLVGLAPLDIQGEIMTGLAQNAGSPYTIEISKPFSIGIEATLGDTQTIQSERFVPLVVKRIFAGK